MKYWNEKKPITECNKTRYPFDLAHVFEVFRVRVRFIFFVVFVFFFVILVLLGSWRRWRRSLRFPTFPADEWECGSFERVAGWESKLRPWVAAVGVALVEPEWEGLDPTRRRRWGGGGGGGSSEWWRWRHLENLQTHHHLHSKWQLKPSWASWCLNLLLIRIYMHWLILSLNLLLDYWGWSMGRIGLQQD